MVSDVQYYWYAGIVATGLFSLIGIEATRLVLEIKERRRRRRLHEDALDDIVIVSGH